MNAYIIAAHRTAVGKAPKGVFKNTRPDDLAVAVIKHLLTVVPQLDKEQIDDVIVGNATPEAEQGLNKCLRQKDPDYWRLQNCVHR